MPTTLILGGGFGGLAAANELRRLLPRDHRITVVDRDFYFTVGSAKTWVMLGQQSVEQSRNPRTKLASRGIRFLRGEIEAIDAQARTVRVSGEELRADHVVIALGAQIDMNLVPGLAEHAHQFYSLEGAQMLHRRLASFAGGKVVILIPRLPFKCPPAPYEAALMLSGHFARSHVQARLSIVSVEGAPMATAGPEIGSFVRQELQRSGITYETLKKTVRVEAGTVLFESGDPIAFDLLIAIPPHRGPVVLKESGLANEAGWVPITAQSCELAGHSEVYAIGDCTALPLPGRFNPNVGLSMPKAGTVAEGQGLAVARRIASKYMEIDPAGFDGRGFCYIEMEDMHAVRGDAEFFAVPNPTMSFRAADMQQYEGKQAWVADTVKRLLG